MRKNPMISSVLAATVVLAAGTLVSYLLMIGSDPDMLKIAGLWLFIGAVCGRAVYMQLAPAAPEIQPGE